MILTILLTITALLIVAYIAITFLRVRQTLRLIRRSAVETTPYSSRPDAPLYHFLILGDSTMFGAGLEDQANSMGGLLVGRFPGSAVETLAINGTKVAGLKKQLAKSRRTHYDLLLVGVGGNDIAMLSNLDKVEKELRNFLTLANKRTNKIILIHCVNVGNIGFFLPPLSYLFDYRTRKLSHTYDRVAKDFKRVTYVNFYRPAHADFYTKESRPQFIASDGFHPSDYANRYFFDLIRLEAGLDEAFLQDRKPTK